MGLATDYGGPGGQVSVVWNTASLQASNPSDLPAAVLLGGASPFDGGGGLVLWASGDQSANVTAYPDQYIPPKSDLTGASGAWVVMIQRVEVTGSNPLGKETLAVSTAAVGFASKPASAAHAFITVETASVRYWVDGSTPTSSAGHLANAGDTIELDNANDLTNFKAIATAADATLQVTYS